MWQKGNNEPPFLYVLYSDKTWGFFTNQSVYMQGPIYITNVHIAEIFSLTVQCTCYHSLLVYSVDNILTSQ